MSRGFSVPRCSRRMSCGLDPKREFPTGRERTKMAEHGVVRLRSHQSIPLYFPPPLVRPHAILRSVHDCLSCDICRRHNSPTSRSIRPKSVSPYHRTNQINGRRLYYSPGLHLSCPLPHSTPPIHSHSSSRWTLQAPHYHRWPTIRLGPSSHSSFFATQRLVSSTLSQRLRRRSLHRRTRQFRRNGCSGSFSATGRYRRRKRGPDSAVPFPVP